MADIIQRLTASLTPTIQALGFELWGLSFRQNGKTGLLQIFIDGPQGVNIDDCARVSRQCSSVLDVESFIQSAYTLEVSSPGMDRQFFKAEQYSRYVGQEIRIKLHQAREARKQWRGPLLEATMDKLTIKVDGQAMVFELSDIDKANLVG